MSSKPVPPVVAYGDRINQLAMGRLVDVGVFGPVGTTAQRPTGLTADGAGLMYFDKTLNKPVWWKGSGWVDATGAAV